MVRSVTSRVYPVIMSGGSGTRLWPVSTEAEPKQFHALASSWTMIQETALRLREGAAGVSPYPPLVVCNERHRDAVYDQLVEAGVFPTAVVTEPVARNTGAVAAIAAELAGSLDPEALVLLMPADHVIEDPAAFWAAVSAGAVAARDRIVVFGIRPSGPETGYGYIKRAEELHEGVFRVESFCEKPDAQTAAAYVESGRYDWNGGIFLFSPAVFLEELRKARPDVLKTASAALASAERVGTDVRLDKQVFAACPSVSIDYAVMETTDRAAVVPCNVGWADIGSWSELWRRQPKDADGNHTHGRAVAVDTRDSLIWAAGGRPVGVVGLSDVLVVSARDGVVVVAKDRAQDVKRVVEALKAAERAEGFEGVGLNIGVEELIEALSTETYAPAK